MKTPCKHLLFMFPLLLSFIRPAYAEQDQDTATAELFGDTVIPTTTFGRSPRPVNQVAENVTIISREEMGRLQAHTLGDVLQYYPGVLAYPMRMQADLSVPMVQGLPNRQTLVTLDGIPLNNGSDGAIDIGIIPIGFLDRIEIVKGPAASVWGRSVGAVINLVTQEPNRDRTLSGQLNGADGTKHSRYGEVHVSGTLPETGTGYFLAATANRTGGFQTNVNSESRSVYAKLTQDIGPDTDISALFARSSANRNILNLPGQNVHGENEGAAYFAIGRVHHQFSPGSDFEAQIYAYNLKVDNRFYNLQPIPPILPVAGFKVQSQGIIEETEGVQLSYKKAASGYWFSLGVDASMSSLRNSDFSMAPPPVNSRKVSDPYNVAEYISAGYNLTRDLTLTGAYRYDWYSKLDNTHSPNVGLIYKMTEKSLLRATYGFGYSLPTISSGSSEFETLWRAQIGFETSDIPVLWLKASGFYDRTRNVKLQLKFFDTTPEKNHALTREGFEIEAKTTPFFDTSLGAGYTYAHIYNSDTEADIKGLPRHHLLLSANYRAHGADATLYARYINWNSTVAKDAFVWDFLYNQRVMSWETGNASIQFSARNIFNASQYSSTTFPNPPLRLDAGLQVNF